MPKIKVMARILPVMIGTAGHVDHGKTALIRNLTGCETDKLQEEKERGLSINLGFAACRFPGRRLAGVVDVPGHETFIRNMVAGAASMDIVMLVVAADDGVMPQTIEHMQIVKLLRTPKVLVVVTKTDLVEEDLLELVKDDVAGFMARLGFPDAPLLCVSNASFEGLNDVRETLEKMVADVQERLPSDRVFRMSIERAFSAKGYGTVVTGIPSSGAVHVGEDLELLPDGRKSGVRFIQSYQLQADQVEANVCGALNLRHIELDGVRRGMTVAVPGAYRPTEALVASLHNVNESHTLKRRSEVKFHTGTAVLTGTCRLVDRDELPPGEDAVVQITLAEPLVVAAGDRYIVRLPSPAATVGGGVVLSARGEQKLNARSAHVKARLDAARQAIEDGDLLAAELLVGPSGLIAESEVLRLTQQVPEAARRTLAAKEESGELERLGGGVWLVASRLEETAAAMKAALRAYHAEFPYSVGMDAIQVCRFLALDSAVFSQLTAALCRDADLVLRHQRLALASFSPSITQQQKNLKEQVVARVRAAGPKPPARGDLMRDLGISEADMRILTRLLAEEKTVKVVRTNLLLYSYFSDFRDKLLGLFDQREVVDIAAFREATGVSRNMAESLLESYDSEGLTRRVTAGRVLIRDPRTPAAGAADAAPDAAPDAATDGDGTAQGGDDA